MSTVCAILLFRRYRMSPSPLLLWSCVCFLGLVVSNIILVLDMLVVPSVDLRAVRSAVSAVSSLVLLFGLIWEIS